MERAKQRGIIWNWSELKDTTMHGGKVYVYYLDLVYDHTPAFRVEKLNEAVNEASNSRGWNFYFEPDRTDLEGKVEGTNFKYLCKVYRSNCPPRFVEAALNKKFHRVSRDFHLYERPKKNKKLNLEIYLGNLHSR